MNLRGHYIAFLKYTHTKTHKMRQKIVFFEDLLPQKVSSIIWC